MMKNIGAEFIASSGSQGQQSVTSRHLSARPGSITSIDVRYGGIRRSSASPRPPCNGTPSASVWPSPRQTPGPPCPHPTDRTPPDATIKRVGAPSAWTSPSDLDRKESDGRDSPQGVAPHAHRGVVGAHELRR